MKLFELPVIEVLKFEIEDVVTASGEEPVIPAMIPPCG